MAIVLPLLMALVTSGCSIRRMALTELAGTLSGGAAGVFASDDDPELIRAAVPFSLKTMEALLFELPEDEPLLLSTCSGFAQYAYAFPATDAERVEDESYAEAEALRVRARKLVLRGRDYCLRALELRLPGVEERLLSDPGSALEGATPDDVPLLYWSAAAWGGALSYGLDQPDLVADLPAVRALFDRALALDEAWGDGAIHGALISLEALPEIMGGSPERARRHFERAVALSGGTSAGPYVSYAHAIARPAGDRAGFVALMEDALAEDLENDPDQRLANEIAQRRARFGLERVDDWFVEEPDTP
jgi:predicted anti-sigma-YlaC factor YlaD